MIISKDGKSYDTSDGSEQPSAGTAPARADGSTARQRWADDGGPAGDDGAVSAVELRRRPGWSVLSLRELDAAARRERRADDPARLLMEAAREEHRRADAAAAAERKLADQRRVQADRHRNAWENT